MQIMDNEIDLIKYGVLWQKVQDMDKKMDKMETQLEELVALANKGKGGLWLGMSVISGISMLAGFVLSWWRGSH
jgi:hypothetical protein